MTDNELDTDLNLSPLPIEEAIDDIVGADLDHEPPSMFPKSSPTLKDSSVYDQTTTLARLSIPGQIPPPNPNNNPRQARPNKYVDELHNEFIEALGSTKELKLALSTSPNPKAKVFLESLTSPRNADKSITRLARKAGLYPGDVAAILRDYHLSSAFIEIVKGAPQVAKDIVYDAQTIQVDCPRCGGFGEVQSPKPETDPDTGKDVYSWIECKRCNGSGLITKAGNSDARKLVGEAVGWTKSKSGPGTQVHVNITNNPGSIESTIEELERISPPDYSNSNIIDIEPE